MSEMVPNMIYGGLRDLPLKKTYDSDIDDILSDFYIPALSVSVLYRRLAGFFSSSTLAVAARGISRLIANGGKMELICGACLSKEDVEAIRNAHCDVGTILEKNAIRDISDIEDEMIRDHVAALGWMVANGKLAIKIAIPYSQNGIPIDRDQILESGIFHQKVGILEDKQRDMISFSGSDNESASAWTCHIEEFKVFRSWIENEIEYLSSDIDKFSNFWSSKAVRTRVLDAPEAIKKELIRIAPADIEELDIKKWDRRWKIGKKSQVMLWKHQNEAVESWFNNGKRGIMEMATGSGKTNIALECIRRLSSSEKKLLCVISTPYDHLTKQWVEATKRYGIQLPSIIADSSNRGWQNLMADLILDISNNVKNHGIIFTTHASLGSSNFIKLVETCEFPVVLVADEVHGLGASVRKQGLLNKYKYRLGLSATPKRWFDEDGTKTIYDYFGEVIYEFSLHSAINTLNEFTGMTFLVPYNYIPHIVELTPEEFEKYKRITEKITRRYFATMDQASREKSLELLYFERAKILNNAVAKYNALERILDEMKNIEHCLIYCSPEQLSKVQDILNSRNIIQHKFTMKERVVPDARYKELSEREHLLKQFAQGKYKALVAIKCLDEGVDIPSARTGILMSSSGNPREFIQRRGRILRRSPGKEYAILHDIVAIPSTVFGNSSSEQFAFEQKILSKEFDRMIEFAKDAQNPTECIRTLNMISKKFYLGHR